MSEYLGNPRLDIRPEELFMEFLKEKKSEAIENHDVYGIHASMLMMYEVITGRDVSHLLEPEVYAWLRWHTPPEYFKWEAYRRHFIYRNLRLPSNYYRKSMGQIHRAFISFVLASKLLM